MFTVDLYTEPRKAPFLIQKSVLAKGKPKVFDVCPVAWLPAACTPTGFL